MLEKLWDVPDDLGGMRCLIPIGLEKTAGLGLTDKEAKQLSPGMVKFIREIKPDRQHPIIIVIPMGAGEWWGSNKRGDRVDEAHMVPDRKSKAYGVRPYGYPTFLNAHFFGYHRNRPHEGHPIIGDVPFVDYNTIMHWIELALRPDREAVLRHYPEMIEEIDAGVFATSMGLRAEADVCTICGNVRRSFQDKACEHIEPPVVGTIFEDGRVAAMSNLFPAWHDLSKVNKRADTLALTIKKVAEAAPEMSRLKRALSTMRREGGIPRVGKIPPLRPDALPLDKISLVQRKARELGAQEPELKQDMLLQKAQTFGPGLLATLMRMGMLLRPPEFQAAYLGDKDPERARGLALRRVTFSVSCTELPAPSPAGEPPAGLLSALAPAAAQKSWMPGPLLGRLLFGAAPDQTLTESPGVWKAEAIPDLSAAYGPYLAGALQAAQGKDADTRIPGLGLATDPEAGELAKEGQLAALSILLPALYFAAMMGQDIAAGVAPTVSAGAMGDRSFLQKLMMFSPSLATSLMNLAGKGALAGAEKLSILAALRQLRGV